MKKYILIAIITALAYPWVYIADAQKSISLQLCYEEAMKNNPRAEEGKLHSQLRQLKQENLKTSWYPEIAAGANILYNSSVVDLAGAFESIPVPGISDDIPVMPNDQYKLTLDINQLLYDGGAVKSSRRMEDTQLELDKKELEADLYQVREQINSYYFSFIILGKQKELLLSYLETINRQLNRMESGIENGVLLPSDREVLKAEKIKIRQQITETDIRKSSVASVLSDLTGLDILPGTEASVPAAPISSKTELARPELQVLELKKEQVEAGKDLIRSNRRPKAFAFATLGYGRPAGNDFFSDSFGPYYIVGAGIKWNIIDWKKSSRKQKIADINKTLIHSGKKVMEDKLSRALEMKKAEIKSLISALESDEELIATLGKVCATALSKYNNGTITASEYLVEFNKEKQAVINREIHRVSLAKARVEYLNIAGKEIE